MQTARVFARAVSDRRKSSLRDLFRRNMFLLRLLGAARETCKETLLRKATGPTAQGFAHSLPRRGSLGPE